MKKLMFAAVAMTACVGLCDIVSQNVVGYQGIETPSGYSMRTPSFQAISGNYKISDIKVAGDDIGWGNEYGQVVAADGSWGNTYYYLNADTAPTEGWYKDMTGEDPVTDDDVLTVGQAFYFSSSADITLTYAGQVIAGTPTVNLPAGYSMLGNPTPIQVKVSDIKVSGVDIGWGNEYGQVVEPSGDWGVTYYYLNADTAPTEGWYKDMTGEDPVTDDDVLAASDALYFNSSADLTIKFPIVIQ